MSGKDKRHQPVAELRQRAEAAFLEQAARIPENVDALSPDAARQTLHELRVHQIELEMQNEELRHAQAELDQMRARYFDLFDLAPVGYCSVGEAGLILEANLTAANLLGVDRRSLAKQSFSRFILKQDQDIYYLQRKQLLQTAAPQAFDLRMVKHEGTQFWAHLAATVAQDEDGATVLRIVLADISERKQGEAAHIALEARLRESQKMEALGTLAAGVAHEFNNILAMISGNVELARQDVGPTHPALESLEEIAKASRRAMDLVQQILAFGRRQTPERKPTALGLVVVETARLLRVTLPALVNLNVECKADTPAVLADATHVKQLLLNLCSNAVHAVQNQERRGVIDVRLEGHTQGEARGDLRAGRYACLTVQDNGPGMDAAVRSHIFEPFFTTKPVGQGTGLGLSVIHGIANNHEANIEVESAPGEGTTFRIYFPAVEAAVPAEVARAAGATPVQGKGKHILYVDDEQGLVLLMTRLLTRQGFRVSGYDDPREALAAARANPDQFDLVVTDYSMPHISGLELAQVLKTIRADLPVVLASGYITEELRAKAPEAGVRELIYKPNTVDDLCNAVARCANEQGGSKVSS